jgi:protein SCO1/2
VSRLPLYLSVATLALLATGCGGRAAAKIETPPQAPRTFAGNALTPPRPAPAIALHDAWGRPVTLAAQRGRYVLVTFLYVHCTDVCPLIAQNLNTALRRLGAARSHVRVLAVSVDPRGDTRAAVRRYIAERGLLPQFRYLIGTKAELAPTWAAWHVLAIRENPERVDHVAYTALVDPRGKERVLYDSKVTAAQVLHDLRKLLAA